MPDPSPVTRMTVRFPTDLYEALAAWAREDGRSLHGQIVYLLRKLVIDRGHDRGPSGVVIDG